MKISTTHHLTPCFAFRMCPQFLGKSNCNIQLTGDTCTHWIEEADQGRTIEVDRLTHAPSEDEFLPQRGRMR